VQRAGKEGNIQKIHLFYWIDSHFLDENKSDLASLIGIRILINQ